MKLKGIWVKILCLLRSLSFSVPSYQPKVHVLRGLGLPDRQTRSHSKIRLRLTAVDKHVVALTLDPHCLTLWPWPNPCIASRLPKHPSPDPFQGSPASDCAWGSGQMVNQKDVDSEGGGWAALGWKEHKSTEQLGHPLQPVQEPNLDPWGHSYSPGYTSQIFGWLISPCVSCKIMH